MSELIGEWVSIEIGQSKVSDSEYEFYINVNGITVHKVELENPEIIDAAKIYATPPNMEAANGNELRNIFFNSQRLPLPLSAKSGDAETSGRAMAKEGGQGQGSKDRSVRNGPRIFILVLEQLVSVHGSLVKVMHLK